MRITVSRVWKGGEVVAFCNDEVVGAEMELSEFLYALLSEAKLEDEKLKQTLLDAAPKVLSKMKKETSKVVL